MRKSLRMFYVWLVGLLIFLAPFNAQANISPAMSTYLDQALLEGRLVQRWNDNTKVIYVYIDSGSHLDGWKPEMVDSVKTAFGEWQTVMEGRYTFEFTNDPSMTDVTIRWTATPQGEELGHQHIRWSGNRLLEAGIDISLHTEKGRLLQPIEIQHIALHEIGHLMGIRGHSTDPGDLMYESIHLKTAKMSLRDIATIKALYQLKPHITNPVGIRLSQSRQFENLIRQGYDAYQKKDYKTAFRFFHVAQQFSPEDGQIAYSLGVCAYNLKMYDMAIQNLQQSAQHEHEYQLEARYFLANALMISGSQDLTAGKPDSGMQKLQIARLHYASIKENPSSPVQLKRLADSHLSEFVFSAPLFKH